MKNVNDILCMAAAPNSNKKQGTKKINNESTKLKIYYTTDCQVTLHEKLTDNSEPTTVKEIIPVYFKQPLTLIEVSSHSQDKLQSSFDKSNFNIKNQAI